MRSMRVPSVDLLVNKEDDIMWRFRTPLPHEFDSEEEYEEALAAYESAYDDYCDMVEEAWREERDR